MRTVEIKTDFGTVKAIWHCEGRMIVVQYGERPTSEMNLTNDVVARDIVRGWTI